MSAKHQNEYSERVDHAPAEQHDQFFGLPVDGLTEAEQRDRPVATDEPSPPEQH